VCVEACERFGTRGVEDYGCGTYAVVLALYRDDGVTVARYRARSYREACARFAVLARRWGRAVDFAHIARV
jgi:hypothetical protein